MGNRAVIKFGGTNQGIYLHWNGGIESVQAFLDCAKRYKLRSGCYGNARLCQIIGNFFGGSLSLGIDDVRFLDCDNYDNGMYVVNEHWEITKREYDQGHNEGFNTRYYQEVFAECCKKNDAIFEYVAEVAEVV